MDTTMRGWAMSVMLSFAAGCGGRPLDNLFDDGPGGGFSDHAWARLRAMSPLPPVPPDLTNQFRDAPAAAALGDGRTVNSPNLIAVVLQ
jgi:hypothetical protein